MVTAFVLYSVGSCMCDQFTFWVILHHQVAVLSNHTHNLLGLLMLPAWAQISARNYDTVQSFKMAKSFST